ncbi:glycosylceramide biosynthesis protein [Schizosaccharomyces cryophilus OY26]|uniref:Glycosylceramide biosynthesis protein n=1 Tax=Schizosaccharomyces cryophilus (strain OY26 / ATCC MYA-4695 / CBS 11777 / NBRC 106824 / NRRL Y48691) TaxID=653667 RepID=S9W0K7_SCHCR|nr:glycosylceramide biosynthesis protein [Schizosaccharomyces cryophilus OY26]EPY53363.1 glycosylceramide biosynthesis protein [Schizosaccharomyces cryophilus OY26]
MATSTKSLAFSAQYVAAVHIICSLAAFLVPLGLTLYYHYHEVVKNEFFSYPDEWFPSVSATIGDWYPERAAFQYLIALAATPRMLVLMLWFSLSGSKKPSVVITTIIGVLRTALCGGWVYVTSTDDHDMHDVFMIAYLLMNAPWFIMTSKYSPPNASASRVRKCGSFLFVGTVFPLIYWYIQHKFKRIPGAYTIYAFFEWSLIFWDVLFDSALYFDFQPMRLNFHVADSPIKSVSSGVVPKSHEDDKKYTYAKAASSSLKKKTEYEPVCSKSHILSSFIQFSSETYLAYIFWSVITSLGLLIWYFPLWHMGISGYEASILVQLSPFLLAIPFLRQLTFRAPFIPLSLTLTGVAAYLVTDPVYRLFTVAFAVFNGCLGWSSVFSKSKDSPVLLERRITTFLLGLIASSVAKYSFFSNNPIWPILNERNGGKQPLALGLGVLATLGFALCSSGSKLPEASPPETSKDSSAFASIFGLGSTLFGLHTLLCDSTILISWAWDGYPIRGPQPYPHGAISIIVALLAIIMAPRLYRSFSFMLFGFVASCYGSYVFYLKHGWESYLGGLVLSSYVLISAFPSIRFAVASSPSKVFGGAFLVYSLYAFAHVWVVAYEFVPGGSVLREKTSYLLIALAVGLFCPLLGYSSFSSKKRSTGVKANTEETHAIKRGFKKSIIIATYLAFMALKYANMYKPPYDYTPYHPDEKIFTAGIWTIHFGLDDYMWGAENRIRDVVRDMELDVFGLLESDTQRLIMGFRDLTQFLSHDLGMYADYGPGPDKHTWGATLFSKFPIVNSTHHLLPSPYGELAPAIHATLDVYGELVDVVVSHNGQYENALDRHLQSTELSRIMKESTRPLVFLGYVVSHVGEEPQTILTRGNGMLDIEPADFDRWCQYILYRGVKRIGYARLHRSTVTDTELQTGKFQVASDLGANVRIAAEKIPESHRYPTKFEGKGINGHYYDNNNVIHEPWYYD